MKLSHEEVKKVAGLANLNLGEVELVKYGEQLSAILDYIDQIDSRDTSGVVPTFNVSGRMSVMRADQVKPGLEQAAATSNGRVVDGLFVAKGVFEEE